MLKVGPEKKKAVLVRFKRKRRLSRPLLSRTPYAGRFRWRKY